MFRSLQFDDNARTSGLIIVAHPDDEAIGAAHFIQRHPFTHVVYCTSGAPKIRSDWAAFGSMEKYAEIREEEAVQALRMLGHRGESVFLRLQDGELLCSIDSLYASLCHINLSRDIRYVITHLCEGGHPDHDICALVGAAAAARCNIPCLHMPLYGQEQGGFTRQRLRPPLKAEFTIYPTKAEADLKAKMFAKYRSQAEQLKDFDTTVPDQFAPCRLDEALQFLLGVERYIVGSHSGTTVRSACFDGHRLKVGDI